MLECNHAFALLISMPPEFSLMPRLKSINFYQNKPNIVIFAKKKIFFLRTRASAPRPPIASGKAPRPPNTALPPLQISGEVTDTRRVLLILSSFRILEREVIELAK